MLFQWFSLHRPFADSVYNLRCQSICLSVCPHLETPLPVDWRLLVKERIANIGIPLDISEFLPIRWYFAFWQFFLVFGSLQISLLCIVWELNRGLSVAVAVGVSDRWQLTCDTQYAIRDMWHLFCLFLSVLVLVLLFSHVKRISASRMQNFFLSIYR